VTRLGARESARFLGAAGHADEAGVSSLWRWRRGTTSAGTSGSAARVGSGYRARRDRSVGWRSELEKGGAGPVTSILRPSLIDQLVLRGVAVGYEVDSSCRGARFQDLALELSPQRVDIRRDRSLERDPG